MLNKEINCFDNAIYGESTQDQSQPLLASAHSQGCFRLKLCNDAGFAPLRLSAA
ncbi:MAG: hypothetical protein ACOH2I_05465 [Pseudomonas sp.]